MSHSVKDVQSLVEVTKLAKDLEHMENQKQLREVGLFSPEKVQSGALSVYTYPSETQRGRDCLLRGAKSGVRGNRDEWKHGKFWLDIGVGGMLVK